MEINGCAECGVGEREHSSRFTESVGQHAWIEPSDSQRLFRMKERQRMEKEKA